MYNETDENGQYQLDCRLDSERDLEENVSIMITFAHKQLEAKVGNNFVKNRYEGYGLLSEHFGLLNKLIKDVNHVISPSKNIDVDCIPALKPLNDRIKENVYVLGSNAGMNVEQWGNTCQVVRMLLNGATVDECMNEFDRLQEESLK